MGSKELWQNPDSSQTNILRETTDAFIAARLLTANTIAGIPTVEVSHEALIREWSRLAEWLRTNRNDILLQQAISEDTEEWARRGKPTDRLYRGTQLAEATAWAERNVPSQDEMDFLQASATERQQQEAAEQSRQARELALQRRVVSRQRLLVVALSIFSVIVIVLASVAQLNYLQAEVQRKNAEMEKHIALEQASNAQSRALAADANASLAQKQLDRALLLSVKALQIADTYEARDSLLSTLIYSPHIITTLHLRPYSPYAVNSIAFSANGDLLFSADDNDVFVWNTRTKKSDTLSPVGSRHPNYISQIAVSRHDQLATLGPDGVWLWNARTGEQLAQLEGNDTQTRPSGYIGGLSLAFSPDSRLLAVGQCQQFTSPGNSPAHCGEAQIFLWDTASKKRLGSPFNTPDTQINSVAFSPDGKIVAAGSVDGTVRLWDVSSGSLIGSPLTASAQPVTSVAFSPDGKTLAAGNDRDTVGLWNMGDNSIISQRLEYTRKLLSAVFSRDGKTLITGSDDGKVVLWDIVQEKPTAILDTAVYPVIKPIQEVYGSLLSIQSLAISGDGRMIAAGRLDGVITLWDMKTKLPLAH